MSRKNRCQPRPPSTLRHKGQFAYEWPPTAQHGWLAGLVYGFCQLAKVVKVTVSMCQMQYGRFSVIIPPEQNLSCNFA
jgi:hypothetical protein